MSLINYTGFLKVYKKRFKLFIILNFIFGFFFILVNQTIFKEKLDKKFSVTFDYEYDYAWSDEDELSFKFNKIISKLRFKAENKEDNVFPFRDLKHFHSNFFSLLYEYNLNDIKGNNYKSNYHKIAKAFNFDNNNFTYKNKKIHVAWNNLKEAEDYLYSLHDRSQKNLQNMLLVNLEDKQMFVQKKLNDFLNIYTLDDLKKNLLTLAKKESVIDGINLNISSLEDYKKILRSTAQEEKGIDGINGLKTDAYLNNIINISGIKEMEIEQIVQFLLTRNIFQVGNSLYNKKKSLFAYYFKMKFPNYINLDEINYFDDYKIFIRDIGVFLPTYNKKIVEIKHYLVYFIQLIISVLISSIIIFFPKKIKRK